MINQCSQQLLAIPGVPLAAAEALVQAGLRVQITGQQLVASAYECFEGLGVWVEAFSAAGVPLAHWAAELPAELRHLVQDLTPKRTADLLAVVLGMAGCGLPGRDLIEAEYIIPYMCQPPAYNTLSQLSAAAVEALLRLAMQSHSRAMNHFMARYLPTTVYHLIKLPAAQQLPTAALVELTQQAMQSTGAGRVVLTDSLLRLLAGRQLTAEQAEVLMSLLRGPTAAAAAKEYCGFMVPDGHSVMVWLASQPGAAAAAARLGLTADDVREPFGRAAALLFGGQQEAGAR
ncbi:hypothetical protein OEZ85_002309 [Tetradesmus obliquus]|uniref:Uncharacterized protein n=1 Tax=Tetradesmus obliquus TaxID=3088 RepID=A0ABY8U2K1_TETOB|nr:hypothetical protein OEZ85_002309 [Tetradesmus obliquus]